MEIEVKIKIAMPDEVANTLGIDEIPCLSLTMKMGISISAR